MSDTTPQITFSAPDLDVLAPFFHGYELEGLIATGGMGAVYGAIQKSLEREVAIKILPKELSKDAAFCESFEAEAKAMARLNHPNLVSVYDFGEVDGMLYIIMEFVPGQSIYHSADGIALDPHEVIRLVAEVCDGLAHAHENGIIHRDIKPSNILLDLNAQPKIGDFGLARPIGKKIQEGEEIFGTPHYTAPEVVDTPNSVDYRADIFSVGVLLHELLTGKLPANDPRPASAISRCSTLFDSIIARATQPHPAYRYSSAKELAADLRAIAAEPAASSQAVIPVAAPQITGPIAGPRPSRPTGNRVVVSRKKSSSFGQLFTTLLLIGAGYYVYVTYYKPLNNQVAPPIKKVTEALPTLLPEIAATPPVAIEQPIPEAPAPPETDAPETGEKAAPSPETPLPPKADIAEFFARARKIMQDKAIPIVSLYKANSKTNFTEFENFIISETRKMKSNGDRLDLLIAPIIKSWRADGDILPEDVNSQLNIVPTIEALSSPFLTKQASIESTLTQAVSQLRQTYILGLQLQSKRYTTSDDPGAVYLTDLEIKQTQENPDYFRNLIFSNN
jgi:serine/threonine protein kinase